MTVTGWFPRKRALIWRLASMTFIREWLRITRLRKGRSQSGIQSQQKLYLILQDVLRMVWTCKAAPSWSRAGPYASVPVCLWRWLPCEGGTLFSQVILFNSDAPLEVLRVKTFLLAVHPAAGVIITSYLKGALDSTSQFW